MLWFLYWQVLLGVNWNFLCECIHRYTILPANMLRSYLVIVLVVKNYYYALLRMIFMDLLPNTVSLSVSKECVCSIDVKKSQ